MNGPLGGRRRRRVVNAQCVAGVATGDLKEGRRRRKRLSSFLGRTFLIYGLTMGVRNLVWRPCRERGTLLWSYHMYGYNLIGCTVWFSLVQFSSPDLGSFSPKVVLDTFLKLRWSQEINLESASILVESQCSVCWRHGALLSFLTRGNLCAEAFARCRVVALERREVESEGSY